MVIDPLEAVIVWLTSALTTVSGRVASKHRYGDGWTETQTGVSVKLDGGRPDLYAKVGTLRLEIGIFAADQVDVVTIWKQLMGLSRDNERFTAVVTDGTALVHFFKPESLLSLVYDDVVKMERGVVFFNAMVSELDAG